MRLPEEIEIERRGEIAEVILNRPEKHNGLNWNLLHGLVRAGRELAGDRRLRAVVLSGRGPSFCAGLDFKSALKDLRHTVQGFVQPAGPGSNVFQECCLIWRRLPVPVVARIQGNCFGGGLQIALGADFRIAAPDARFSIMEIKHGLIPDMSGTVTLRELLPMDQIKLLTMTGRILPATQARELGLVTELADDPELATEALVEELLTRSPDALAATKALLQENWLASERKALANERRWQRRMLTSPNRKIAMARSQGGEERPYRTRRR